MTSTSKEVGSEEPRAALLLELGRDSLLLKEIPRAVCELSEASEILSKKFGDKADECAVTLLYYGKALLELSKIESAVISNALEGVDMDGEDKGGDQVEDPEKLSDTEKAEVKDQVSEAMEENFDKIDKLAQLAKIHSVEEVGDEGGDSMEETEGEPCSTAKDPADVEKETTETAEDTDNLQLSWEVLEVAKTAFINIAGKSSGEDKKDAELKYCETMMVLGEIGLENENYTQAVEDFGLCLIKRVEVLPADSRSIAEVYYELGMAQGSLKLYTEAEKSLNSAFAVLQLRITNLKKMETSKHLEAEIADLETLIGEIQAKVKDHKDEAVGKMEITGAGNKMDKMVLTA